jgi:hypothetical protein
MLALHLAPDGVGALFAAINLDVDVVSSQLGLESLLDLVDRLAALLAQPRQALRDRSMGFWIENLKRQVLQFVAHRLHAHAPGQRRVDVDGLLGNALALVGRHVVERAHVVQPVGELDQQHPDVLGHRDEELAQVLCLGGFPGHEIETLDLGQPLHQAGDVGAEQLLDLLVGCAGVLDDVMQQRSHDRGIVELQLGEDGGNFQRMREIGIPRGADLAAMGLHGIDVGAIKQRLVGVAIVGRDPFHQLVLAHHDASSRPCQMGRTHPLRAAFKPPPKSGCQAGTGCKP